MPRLEEALLVALEAERKLSEQRARLPGLLQHDLSNAMCQVTLTASMLTDVRDGEEQARRLTELQGGIKRVNELLTGMKTLFLTRGNPNDFARDDLAAFVAALVREPGVWPEGAPIALDLPERADVVFSPLLLRHVLVNLIGNAVAYCRGTWVRVHLGRTTRENWQLAVANGGPGIPAGDKRYFFDHEPNEEGARTPGVNGLGLYIAQTCVRFHGSVLRVRSRDRLTVLSFPLRSRPQEALVNGRVPPAMFAA